MRQPRTNPFCKLHPRPRFRLRVHIPLAAVLVFSLTLRAQSHIQSPTADSLAALVDAHYNHLSSLRARFTEHYSGFNRDLTETGVLTLKKPGRMRWDYIAPEGKRFVVDGKYAWFYSPGEAQAERVPAKQLDDLRSPMRYLLGHADLKKELTALTIAPVPDGFTLSGTPKSAADNIRRITLTVSPAGQLLSLRVEQTDGTTTDFQFSAIQENPPLKNSDFLFTPPDGIPVVNSMPPI